MFNTVPCSVRFRVGPDMIAVPAGACALWGPEEWQEMWKSDDVLLLQFAPLSVVLDSRNGR